MDNKVTEPTAVYSTTAIRDILVQIDQMTEQLQHLRAQVLEMLPRPSEVVDSVQETEYFGMWADHEDIRDLDSSQWLRKLRERQWGNS